MKTFKVWYTYENDHGLAKIVTVHANDEVDAKIQVINDMYHPSFGDPVITTILEAPTDGW